jgi:hypothetical protein
VTECKRKLASAKHCNIQWQRILLFLHLYGNHNPRQKAS